MPKKTVGFFAVVAAVLLCAAPAHGATCAPGYSLNSGACHPCARGAYCPGDDMSYPCPDTNTDFSWVYNADNVLTSDPLATSAQSCYLDRSLADFWIYEFTLPGFYRVSDLKTGKCYYSPETKIYNNCNAPKYFSECQIGRFFDQAHPLNAEFTNSCTPCAPGTYNNSSTAVTFPTGMFYYIGNLAPNANACTLCAPGTYADTSGSTSCGACDADNVYAPGAGATACQTVPPGYHKVDNATIDIISECGDTPSYIHVGERTIRLMGMQPTNPSLAVRRGNLTCWAALVSGRGPGINVLVDGEIYHTPLAPN